MKGGSDGSGDAVLDEGRRRSEGTDRIVGVNTVMDDIRMARVCP